MESAAGCFGAVVIAVFFFVMGMILGNDGERKEWQQRLAKQNYAIYETNPNTGDVSWRMLTLEEIKKK